MQFDHSEQAYATQLATKKAKTLNEFHRFGVHEIEVFRSPITAFRYRAEFGVWHKGDTAQYTMRAPGNKSEIIAIDQFPIAALPIQALMPRVLAQINSNEILKRKLFQIEFLTTTTSDTLITLIYHRALDEQWLQQASEVARSLDVKLVGRARKQKIIVDSDLVTETFTVRNQQYHYKQKEASFSQPNAPVNEQMINWATDNARGFSGDLLELYCGNGNFTIPLAKAFNKVLATEIAKSSIQCATENCQINQTDNIQFVRMSSEEIVQALNGVRPFRRLRNIDLDAYQFSTLLVDPPRAGLDATTRALAERFTNVIYISCNPETLARDLDALQGSHELVKFALFDQFPYTAHRECGVILRKRP